MITEAIAKIVKGENLDKEMAAAVMDEIMSGEATQAQIGSFLTALHIKGETIDEITAFAEIMRKHCGEFTPDVDEEIDIVGTGGDCAGTFNISTVSSLVTAAGGGKVAKHGNRASQRSLSEGSWYLLLICTEISHSHEICRRSKKRDQDSYSIQYLRTSCKSGKSKSSVTRCL